MRFKLCLIIHGFRHLPLERLSDYSESNFVVKIEWKGSGRMLPGGIKKNYTSRQPVQEDGAVRWNQQFNRICKLYRMNSQSYKSWIINLEIQELDQNLKGRIHIIGKTIIDVAEYDHEFANKSIKLPMKCNIRDETFDIVLKVRLQLVQLRSIQVCSFGSFSCIGSTRNCSGLLNHQSNPLTIYPYIEDSSSEDEPEVTYEDLATTNILLIGQSGETEDFDNGKKIYQQESSERVKEQPSLVRLLSSKRKLSLIKTINHHKGEPLLNKSHSEVGGDDIDNERLHQSSIQFIAPPLYGKIEAKAQQPENQALGFEEGQFEVGVWENKTIVSRDGQMELVTDIFLASIDQRSEKAAGASACSVLAVVIAHWLHENPNTLPLRCQFDELVHEGSREWRKLCADENYKDKFFDQHFDLDTVLEAKVRPLSEAREMSYVGFFSIDSMPNGEQSLQETMSFDFIWNKILHDAATEEQIYIGSWNDHFFVIKIENGAIYLIDTLGERLIEGCNQAYILKFDEKSVIYSQHKHSTSQGGDSGHSTEELTPSEELVDEDENPSKEVVSEGILSCKDYIKGFLAALPLRELEEDVKRGVTEEVILHRRLQIEFHCTAPCYERDHN